MHIKYGDLTIIYNKEQVDIFTSFVMWLKYEEKPPINSKYVFLFDDGEICDSDNNKNLNFEFCNSILSVIPKYFEKKIKKKNYHNHVYFYKKPIHDKNDNSLLRFDRLFNSYSKYDFCINIKSDYNGIYYCNKDSYQPEIFGLIRIKSNENMPRFQFAYDSDEFTKEEIVNLIHNIFNPLDLENESK